jgi:hypothetical protein
MITSLDWFSDVALEVKKWIAKAHGEIKSSAYVFAFPG